MTIHPSLLAPGLLLLLFPADRLLSSHVELRSFDSFKNLRSDRRYRPWWWVPALWVDPLRSWGGTLLLLQSFELRLPGSASAVDPQYWIAIATLGLAVACQTFTRRVSGVLLAPIGFVAGLVAALVPPPVAMIGFAAAVTGLFAFRHFHAFFTVSLFVIGALGLLLHADRLWLFPAIALLALPPAIGIATRCALELPTRDDSGPPRSRVPA